MKENANPTPSRDDACGFAVRPFVVSIEGNIGSGKSTVMGFLKKFSTDANIRLLDEPIESWKNIPTPDGKTVNLFQLMYEDPKTYGFQFQLYNITTMMENHEKARELCHNSNSRQVPISILERSLASSVNIFTPILFENGHINSLQAAIFQRHVQTLLRVCSTSYRPEVDLILYVKTDPGNLYQRIVSRGRAEEQGHVSSDYLRLLHEKHESWLLGKKRGTTMDGKTRVLTIDGNQSMEEMEADAQAVVGLISEYAIDF